MPAGANAYRRKQAALLKPLSGTSGRVSIVKRASVEESLSIGVMVRKRPRNGLVGNAER